MQTALWESGCPNLSDNFRYSSIASSVRLISPLAHLPVGYMLLLYFGQCPTAYIN